MANTDSNFVYDEIPVDVKTSSSKRATPEEIVALGEKIWKEIQNSGIAAEDEKGNDSLLETLQEKYKDFSTSFPIIMRFMVQMRKFNKKALLKYLRLHATSKLASEDEFLELQAEYLVLLYRETHPHPNEAYIKEYRRVLIDRLKDESRAFKEISKAVEEDQAKRDAAYDEDRRKRLHAYITNLKQANGPGRPPVSGKPTEGSKS